MKSARWTAALIAALVLVLSAGCMSSGSGPAQGPGMSRYGGSGSGGSGGGGGSGYRSAAENRTTRRARAPETG